MNWEAVSAISEIIGAIAVASTLFYHAIQIRHSSTVAREQAHYHMLENQVSFFDRLATDRDMPTAGYRWQFKAAGFGQHWDFLKDMFDPGFVEFMEAEVIPDAQDA